MTAHSEESKRKDHQVCFLTMLHYFFLLWLQKKEKEIQKCWVAEMETGNKDVSIKMPT